ncbi:MAG TPA: SDR family NAD(P)-dependent oxidoreductase [Acidimicrobiales bacterium]|nr:SDR family NAD(P)-dependent oxidoreductase [Acidimicrobiales bacterium]
MELAGRVAVVTGAANGIGKACAAAFAREGARVVVSDLDGAATAGAAEEIGALGIAANVGVEADIQRLVAETEARLGPIDLFHSNAGIGVEGGIDAPDELWERIWKVNTMAHVYAARAVLPSMLSRGEGYLVSTASAAGLLTQIGNASYAVTKHAAVALAEWLAITYGDQGIKVSCLCPQGVNTNMLRGGTSIDAASTNAVLAGGDVLEPSTVADIVVESIRDERFLILPHPEVLTYMQRKTGDYDRWLGGMRKLQARTRPQSSG